MTPIKTLNPCDVVARAPMRIDFSGGPSDVPPFCDIDGGAVTNVLLISMHWPELVRISIGYRVVSDDYNREVYFEDLNEEVPLDETEYY